MNPDKTCTCCCYSSDGTSMQSRAPRQLLCATCVQKALHHARRRRETALGLWSIARRDCASLLQESSSYDPTALSELQSERQFLSNQLEELREKCSNTALRVYAAQVRNDERQSLLSYRRNVQGCRHALDAIRRVLTEDSGAMVMAIKSAQKVVRKLRFQWASAAIQMHRLDVQEIDSEDSKKLQVGQRKHARGIGKIGGFPLPHAGPELFGVLPHEELQSALRLVASLVSLVSRCLGIILPHPVMLEPDAILNEDIADTSWNTNFYERESAAFSVMQETLPNAALISSLPSTNHHPILLSKPQNFVIPPSMDSEKVTERLHHATAAVLHESHEKPCSSFALKVMNEDDFAIALQLLQNDVVALCIRAGVPVAKLWPAEAVLLNLNALHVYCLEVVQGE